MNILSFLLFGIPFMVALALSWHPALGRFRRSALNPLLLIAGYIVLVAGDYASIAITGSGELANRGITTTHGNLSLLQVKYLAMLLALLAGVATAFFAFERLGLARAKPPGRSSDIRVFATVAYVFIFLAWLAQLLQYAQGGLSLEATAEIKNASSVDALLFTVSLMLLPAITYFMPKQSLRVVLPVVVFSIALLLFSGSRTRILYVLVPFMFYFVMVRRWRIPRQFFGIGAVVLGFLALIAVNYRVVVSNGGNATFADVATASNVFNANDVSFAETSIALSTLPRRAVEEYPGQNLVGFAFAAVPRAVVPFKPLKGSDQFTQVYDPVNWRLFKRGLTIGAVNELQSDYQLPVALTIIFLFAAAWAFGFARAAASRSIHGFAWCVGLYSALYAFLKADIQSSSQVLSVFVIYTLMVRAYQRVSSPPARAPRAHPAIGRPPATAKG